MTDHNQDAIINILADLYWITGRIDCAVKDNKCIESEMNGVLLRVDRTIRAIEPLQSKEQP